MKSQDNGINFKEYIEDNKERIYATAPKITSLSKDDEWAKESEWDEFFKELSLKEN